MVQRHQGFCFLGFNIRRYQDIMLVKPQKEKVQAHLQQLKYILTTHRQATLEQLIRKLNPVIQGWVNYYGYVNAKETFNYVGHRLWRWARRRHPNKSAKWVKQHYYTQVGHRQMVFGNGKVTIRQPAATPIIRYSKVKGRYSPYNPNLRSYWPGRQTRQVAQQVNSGLKQSILKQQDYRCGQCHLPFLPSDTIHFHHIVPRHQGGSDAPHNRQALHAHCHYQFHQRYGYRSSRLEPLAG